MSLHREIRSLTGLRGVAACYVMLYHFTDGDNASAFVKHGYLSVDLFFVLSGFVMALTYARDFERRITSGDYLHFLGKRIARVYPAYLAVTLVMMAFIGFTHERALDAKTVVANLLMLQSWGLADSLVPPSWSISTEFAAYVAFPLLVLAALRSRAPVAVSLGLLCVASIAWMVTLTPADLHQVPGGPLDIYSPLTGYPVLRCLAGFTLGMLAFRMLGDPRVRGVFERRHSADALSIVVLALLATRRTDALVAYCFVPLVMTLAVGYSFVGRLLSSGLVYWLGLVSYSVYLIHQPLRRFLNDSLWPLAQASGIPHAYTFYGLALMLLVAAVATVVYYMVEKPGRDFLNGVFRSKVHTVSVTSGGRASGVMASRTPP